MNKITLIKENNMPIINYPERIYKTIRPAIDHTMEHDKYYMWNYATNILGDAINQTVSCPVPYTYWDINSISFSFSAATARDYYVRIQNGRNIYTNYNDYLWFQVTGSMWELITIPQGFYTGTTLATQLQTQLNANPSFIALGRTFTVAYDNVAGTFTITPSSQQIKYIQTNTAMALTHSDSIGGCVFGLTTNPATFGATVVNLTTLPGLNSEAVIINQPGSVVTEHYHDDIHHLTMDQAIHITTNNGVNININAEVSYKVV